MILEDVTPTEIATLREELIALCAQAFADEPWRDPPGRAIKVVDRIEANVDMPAFRLVVSRVQDMLAGFAYGYVDTFCAGLAPRELRLEKAFELVDLAVAPMYQGRGIGRKLHDAVLAEAPEPRLLLTHQALQLRSRYAGWGWRDLGDVALPGSEATWALMMMMS